MSLKTPDGAVSLKKIMRESPRWRKAPEGATVLFDGTTADAWQKGTFVDFAVNFDVTTRLFGETVDLG